MIEIESPYANDGSIYFARLASTGAIKVGFTVYDVPIRLREVRVGGEKPVAVLAISGNRALEAKFHALFEPHHLGGEWFAPSQFILSRIVELISGQFDWSILPAGWSITRPYQTKASVSYWGVLSPASQAS